MNWTPQHQQALLFLAPQCHQCQSERHQCRSSKAPLPSSSPPLPFSLPLMSPENFCQVPNLWPIWNHWKCHCRKKAAKWHSWHSRTTQRNGKVRVLKWFNSTPFLTSSEGFVGEFCQLGGLKYYYWIIIGWTLHLTFIFKCLIINYGKYHQKHQRQSFLSLH